MYLIRLSRRPYTQPPIPVRIYPLPEYPTLSRSETLYTL